MKNQAPRHLLRGFFIALFYPCPTVYPNSPYPTMLLSALLVFVADLNVFVDWFNNELLFDFF